VARTVLPHHIKVRVWGLGGERFRRMMGHRLRQVMIQDVDWSRSVAFPWGSAGFIQVNQKEREPEGCVAPEDSDRVLSEVTAYLRTLRDPRTGEAVVGEILRCAEVYGESPAGYAPDMIVDGAQEEYSTVPWWKSGGAQVVNLEDEGEKPRMLANHRTWGIVATCGPSVKAGTPVPDLGMTDMAPALLYLAGAPIPVGLDGRLKRELWDTGREPEGGREAEAATASAAVTPYTEEEQAAVERRLTDLGYM
jgi:predicted AlkP superfamily phosphohydrolase/phosphomutase